MFMFGLVLALLGTLFGLPEMRERLQLDLGQQGDLFLLLYLGILPANLASGPTIDRFGHRPVLLASSLLVLIALLIFGTATSFAPAATAAILLGAGAGGLNTATTALVSDLYKAERASMLSFLGIFFGIGALLIPLLAASLEAYFTVVELLFIAAGLAAACLLAYSVLSFPPARHRGSISIFEALRVTRNPGVLLFAFVLLCQSGVEGAVSGWTSSYLNSRGVHPTTSTWVLSGYWAGIMAGRGLAGMLLRIFSNGQVLVVSAFCSLAGLTVLLAATSVPVLAACAAFLGLVFASIFPAVLGMAGDRYKQSIGSVFALMFSVAVFGGMSFPWAVGHVGEAFGLRAGLLVPIAGMALECALIVMILRRDGRG